MSVNIARGVLLISSVCSRPSSAQPLHVRQNVGIAPLVAIIVDAAVSLPIDNSRKRGVLDLTGLIFNHADAEGFPDFGEILSTAGEKRPTLGVCFEPSRICVQDWRGVTFRIGSNAQQAIVRNVLPIEVSLNGGEVSCQQRTDVGAGRENEGDQNDLSACTSEMKGFAVLISELEIGHRDVYYSPSGSGR